MMNRVSTRRHDWPYRTKAPPVEGRRAEMGKRGKVERRAVTRHLGNDRCGRRDTVMDVHALLHALVGGRQQKGGRLESARLAR